MGPPSDGIRRAYGRVPGIASPRPGDTGGGAQPYGAVMAGDEPHELTRRPTAAKRERVVRMLTFWLRPEFVLRVVNRFQKVVGFDRAIALASGALTAMIPLSIVASVVAKQLGGKDTADRIIDRYELTGGGAEAVKDIFAPPSGTSTTIGIVGFLFLLVAVLSFTRAVQRLF